MVEGNNNIEGNEHNPLAENPQPQVEQVLDIEAERSRMAREFAENLQENFPRETKTFGPEGNRFSILKTPLKIENPELPSQYGTDKKIAYQHLIASPNGPRILELIEYPNGVLSSFERSEEALQERIFKEGEPFRKPGEGLTVTSAISMSESPFYLARNGVPEVVSLGSMDPGHSFQLTLGNETNSFGRLRRGSLEEIQTLLDHAKQVEGNVIQTEQQTVISGDVETMGGLNFNPIQVEA